MKSKYSETELELRWCNCHLFLKQYCVINYQTTLYVADTPQFRGGNPYFFSENPYQSVSFIYASMYRDENVHAIDIVMEFAKKLDIV